MQLAASFLLGSGARRLQTALVTNRASAAGSNTHVYTGISLGEATQNRTFYLMYSARTNSTTGQRRLNTATLTVGATPHAFSYLHDPGVTHHPSGIMQLALPQGTTGTLTLNISGNTTGWVSGLVTIWAVHGRFERLMSGIVGGNALLYTTQRHGAILHQAASSLAAPLGVPTGLNVADGSWTLNGLTVRSGRNTLTPTGSVLVATNNAIVSLGISLAQR